MSSALASVHGMACRRCILVCFRCQKLAERYSLEITVQDEAIRIAVLLSGSRPGSLDQCGIPWLCYELPTRPHHQRREIGHKEAPAACTMVPSGPLQRPLVESQTARRGCVTMAVDEACEAVRRTGSWKLTGHAAARASWGRGDWCTLDPGVLVRQRLFCSCRGRIRMDIEHEHHRSPARSTKRC